MLLRALERSLSRDTLAGGAQLDGSFGAGRDAQAAAVAVVRARHESLLAAVHEDFEARTQTEPGAFNVGQLSNAKTS